MAAARPEVQRCGSVRRQASAARLHGSTIHRRHQARQARQVRERCGAEFRPPAQSTPSASPTSTKTSATGSAGQVQVRVRCQPASSGFMARKPHANLTRAVTSRYDAGSGASPFRPSRCCCRGLGSTPPPRCIVATPSCSWSWCWKRRGERYFSYYSAATAGSRGAWGQARPARPAPGTPHSALGCPRTRLAPGAMACAGAGKSAHAAVHTGRSDVQTSGR